MEKVHFVRASGEAAITAKPDRAEITIGVATQASTAVEASTLNASESTKMLKAMSSAIGAAGQVKTSNYGLTAQYDYSNNHAPRLTGYQATNSVLVTLDDLALIGKVIDAATASGGNEINGISFLLRDDSALRAQALADAATKARANAEAIAKALGVRVVGILQAEPTEVQVPRPHPMMAMAAGANARAATPIETGDLEIRASVTVTLEVN